MAHYPTLTETVLALCNGEVSSEDIVQSSLDRIDELNDTLGTFIHVDREGALKRAREADEQLSAAASDSNTQAELPALLGVPTALKDGHEVAGMPTTFGTLINRDEYGEFPIASESDPLAQTLEAAGTVMLGKTQVPEFLLNCYSENRIFPPARNPHSPEHSPGGSSGGQAAAVASGMLPAAIGSDGGGSVRIPAAACGLIGLKPNRGRVPSSDALNNVGQLGVNGPIARTALDAALLMDVLCHTPGHTAIDRPVQAVPEPSFTAAVSNALTGNAPWGDRQLRIGVSTASPFEGTYDISVSPEAELALSEGVRQLQALGHEVEEAQINYLPGYAENFFKLWTTAVGQIPLSKGQDLQLTGLARHFRSAALDRSAVDLSDAVSAIRVFEADTIAQYAEYDMILTPALAMPPRRIGWYFDGYDMDDPRSAERDYMRQCQYTPYTSFINVVGLPAITVPTVWTQPESGDYPGKVPMGVQLVGAASSEAWLLALAAQLNPPTDSPAA
ncbi:amidase [Kocuria carniphila]|uniref:amidase n=1 Tax=Kocuria carniphila TaxID=262208 RepID=UPI0034CD88F2